MIASELLADPASSLVNTISPSSNEAMLCVCGSTTPLTVTWPWNACAPTRPGFSPGVTTGNSNATNASITTAVEQTWLTVLRFNVTCT